MSEPAAFGSESRPPREGFGWIARLALLVLWAGALADLALWGGRIAAVFSSKASYASHFWPYLSLGAALAGLLARGAPNALRSVPTVWLVASLAILHGRHFLPPPALPAPRGPTIRVLTLNLSHYPEKHSESLAYLKTRKGLDLVLLQEIHGTVQRGDRPRLEAALRGGLPHSAWYHDARDGRFGLAILSRYPLREGRTVRLPAGSGEWKECRPSAALSAKAIVRGRPVRVATAHLCRPWFPWKGERNQTVPVSLGALLGWPRGVRETEYARRSQIEHLRRIAEGGTGPFILGGDFNTTPVSLDLLRLSPPLRSAFGERGFGLGFTYHEGFFGARLDHIFYGDGLRARGAAVEPVAVSDHRPLEAVLELLPGEAR